MISQIWADTNRHTKDDANKHAKVDSRKDPDASTLHKECRQLRKAKSWRNSPLRGRAHQFVTQYQMLRSENIYTGNILQTEPATFRKMYVYAYVFT